MTIRVSDIVHAQPWAITQHALKQIAQIASRAHNTEEGKKLAADLRAARAKTPSALSARQGQRIKDTALAWQRGPIGIIPVTGPIIHKGNMLDAVSGISSFEILSQDLAKLTANPDISAIVLDIDSPGGTVAGTAEMAEHILKARQEKPVIAYASANCASAAYWIASACTEIIAHSSSALGSIGVVCSYPVQESPNLDGDMWLEIVSSNASKKRPDPRTEEGLAEIRRELDDFEALFHQAVASNRNTTVEDVIENFGGGGMLIASEAVAVGMADRTGNFEDLLTELTSKPTYLKGDQFMSTPNQTKHSTAPRSDDGVAPVVDKNSPDYKQGFEDGQATCEVPDPDAAAKAATAERERICAIQSLSRPGHENLIAAAIQDGKSTAQDVALAIVKSDQNIGVSALDTARAASATVAGIEPSASNTPPGSKPTLDQEDQSIPIDDRAKAAWDADPTIKSEYKTFETYLSYRKGAEKGLLRTKK